MPEISSRVQKKASNILAEKLKLEKHLKQGLKVYFQQCKQFISQGKSIPSSQGLITFNAKNIVKTILDKKVKKIDVSKYYDPLVKKITPDIKSHYTSIDKTSDKRLETAKQAALEANTDKDGKLTGNQSSINKSAAVIFYQGALNRINNIAVTETGSLYSKSQINLYNESKQDFLDELDDEDYDDAEDISDLNDSIGMEDAVDQRRHGIAMDVIAPIVLNAKMQWVTADDDRVCDECDSIDGEIVELDETFSNGWSSPDDSHFQCRCSIVII